MKEKIVRATLLFWPLVLIVFVLGALALAGPPKDSFFGAADTELRMVYLTVISAGMTMVAAARLLFNRGPEAFRQIGLWLCAFAFVFAVYQNRYDLSQLYDRMRGNIHPSVALTVAEGVEQLDRAWDGHYRAEADVNGVPMRMMIDTGATMVLLPYESAMRLGFDPDDLSFEQPVTTANGKSAVAPVRIDSIQIGTVTVRNVQGAVAQPGQLHTGLLGMTFIERFREARFGPDRLILIGYESPVRTSLIPDASEASYLRASHQPGSVSSIGFGLK